MTIEERLSKVRSETLAQIAAAASNGDAHAVINLSQKSREIETLLAGFQQLRVALEVLEGRNMDRNGKPDKQMEAQSPHGMESASSVVTQSYARQNGHTTRANYVTALRQQGYALHAIRETQFETPSGNRVGIAFATERKPNCWFLGLPDNNYSAIILLCKHNNNELLDFFVSGQTLQGFQSRLVASGGQLKFNVRKSGGNYTLLVPGANGVGLNKARGNTSVLAEL